MSLTIIDSNNIFQKDVIGNVRKAQEDSHDIAALTPNGDVFVVCDGMGGHVGGKQASTIAVKSIIEYLKKEKYPDPEQALGEALQFANMQILGYANVHPELKGMGTTACIVLLQDSDAYIAHVGDSRIYLYLGKEKQLHRITKDHSFVQTLVDTGQITDEEAEHHPNKNRILKALGIKTDLAPSIDKVSPKNGDIFLICSDGLSGMISDAVIESVMAENANIKTKGENLIGLALEAGGLDNITLELIRIINSNHTKSIFKSYNPTSDNKTTDGISKIIKPFIITLVCLIALSFIVLGIHGLISKKQHRKQIDTIYSEIGVLKSRLDSLESGIDIQTYLYNGAIESAEKIKTEDLAKNPSNNEYKRIYDKYLGEADHFLKEIESLVKEKKIDSLKLTVLNDSLKTLTQK